MADCCPQTHFPQRRSLKDRFPVKQSRADLAWRHRTIDERAEYTNGYQWLVHNEHCRQNIT